MASIKRSTFARLLIAAFVLAVFFLARPALHLVRTLRLDHPPRPETTAGTIDDASRLNPTRVAEVWRVPVDEKNPEVQIAALLSRAQAEGRRVSIAGARHSMGGHTFYPGGIVLDMRPFNTMRLDPDRPILTVQAGALWKDIIPFLDKNHLSVGVMQSNDSFTVGGSLSVNCHGWPYYHPPISSTVESFRLMMADGTIRRCSREENQELFSLALGGYGLFGVILDAELRVVPNEWYRLEQYVIPVDKSIETFQAKIQHLPGLRMFYARLNVTPNRLFKDVIINGFVAVPGELPPLTAPNLVTLKRAIFRGSALNDYGKELRYNAETHLQPWLIGKYFSRNQLLYEDVDLYANHTDDSTDILHEYFVPRARATAFVDDMRKIITRQQPNLLNVTVRLVKEDTDTFLRYADQPVVAFVMLFVQEKTPEGEARMSALTRDLIEAAINNGGRYYLPYRLHATPEQFHRAYPMARKFFERKRKYDPAELFQNNFYARYGKT